VQFVSVVFAPENQW